MRRSQRLEEKKNPGAAPPDASRKESEESLPESSDEERETPDTWRVEYRPAPPSNSPSMQDLQVQEILLMVSPALQSVKDSADAKALWRKHQMEHATDWTGAFGIAVFLSLMMLCVAFVMKWPDYLYMMKEFNKPRF